MVGVKIDEEENDGTFTKVDLDHLVQSTIENAKNEDDIEDEVKIFQNALDFQDTKVRDCMVPRTEIKAVEESCSLEELQQMFIESGNSKIIVYEGDIDHIKGYIHSSEMFRSPKELERPYSSVAVCSRDNGSAEADASFPTSKEEFRGCC